MKASLVIETGEARELHHFAVLSGFGVEAINPYLAFETIRSFVPDSEVKLSEENSYIFMNASGFYLPAIACL